LLFANGDFFAVENIEIRQEDKNSLIAKQKALSKSLYVAFAKLLLDKFNVNAAKFRISEKQRNDCIYDYSIEHEKYSDSVYIAKISYRFSRLNVINTLRKNGVNVDDNTIENDEKQIKIAIDLAYFIDNYGNFKNLDYVFEKFTSEKIVLAIKNISIEDFEKLDIEYDAI
jgi:hypothetical protein